MKGNGTNGLIRCLLVVLVGVVLLGQAGGQPEKPAAAQGGGAKADTIRFEYVDIYVDSGATPLAAWQVEFKGGKGVSLVGIEGGDKGAYEKPSYYDPAAMMNDRVILAAFSTDKPETLPTGRVRVARLHLQITGPRGTDLRAAGAEGNQEGADRPAGQWHGQYKIELKVAADSEGNQIKAAADAVAGESR